mgnify:CR=1 FL=1
MIGQTVSNVRYGGRGRLSTLFAGAVGMDKLAFGGLMHAAGIPSLPREAVSTLVEPSFAGPYIVKPRFGGSSIGIEIADDIDAARALAATSVHLRTGAVLEPYRPALVDLNIAFRTFPSLEITPLEKPLRGDAGSALGDKISTDSSFLSQIDPRLARPFLMGFADAGVTVFAIAAVVVAIAIVLAIFTKAPALRTKSAVQEAASAAAH